MGARGYVTSGVSSKVWPTGFPNKCATVVVGEITVTVSTDGKKYTVNNDAYDVRAK